MHLLKLLAQMDDPQPLDFIQNLCGDFMNIVTPERAISFWQVIITLLISFLLGLLITQTYAKTHRGTTYSQSFCHTIIIMAMVVGHFGLFESAQDPITLQKIIRAAFLVLGAIVTVVRV